VILGFIVLMSIPDFAAWLETPLGHYLIEWEQAQIDAQVADVFGFRAVQIGLPERDYLRESRIGFRFCCDEYGCSCLRAAAFALPLASQSVDLVVLPHVLEFSSHPHQVLREVERVLVPEGQVVIAGMNPISLWGARRMLARTDGVFPWQGQFLSLRRLKDWLQLLGFEVQSGCFGAYIPPVQQQKWIERWDFMDRAGRRWWPIAGGAYVVRAVKRVQGMRLISPHWRNSLKTAQKLAPVAQKRPVPTQQNRF